MLVPFAVLSPIAESNWNWVSGMGVGGGAFLLRILQLGRWSTTPAAIDAWRGSLQKVVVSVIDCS